MEIANGGVCFIKEEYVIKDRCRIGYDDSPSKNASDSNITDLEPPVKKIKVDENEAETKTDEAFPRKPKQKLRGQNKGRPKPLREPIESKPCLTIVNVLENEVPRQCKFSNCKFIHNPLDFLKIKPKDIGVDGGKCYIYNLRGQCPWGLSCRYGSTHITENGRNLVMPEVSSKYSSSTLNLMTNDILFKLQKRKYDLSAAENLVNDTKKMQSDNKKNEKESKIEEITENETHALLKDENNLKPSGCVTDEDIIPLRSDEKKNIDWKDKLYLGPLTTLGNLPFRRICKEYGADITCGEMALCDSLLKGLKQEWALVKRHESENVFGVQICGSNPYCISKTAMLLENEINVDFVDLNLGCPIDLIYKKGAGCGLLLRNNSLESSIRCASKLLSIPFTIKTRTGVYQDTKIAHNLAPKFFQWGVSMMTIHGRSREQRYTKFADWEYINKCALAAKPCPVFGNGDIMSYDDYVKAYEKAPDITGVMIGRGALIKPWVFTEIKEEKLWDIRSSERFEILKKYTNYGLDHWGSDTQGVESTRRFLLEWLSFLHRYVPVGVLEQPPQRINERPPSYIGRDDLETLMASSICTDWVKISEMLLGPVPEGFQFLPKHRANSY